MMHLAVAALLALAQNDKTQANSYDDAWEAAWKAHCQAVVNAGSGKTAGLVLHIGDSITYSMAYGSWIRGGTGQTPEDSGIVTWFQGTNFPSGINATVKSGIYLANRDVGSNRSFTAAGGIATDEILSGSGNGGPNMPMTTVTSTAQGYIADPTYSANIHLTTLAAAFADAQFAVIMLGTNDCSAGRSASLFIADLQTIVTTLENRNIAVVLSTIPPHYSNDALAQQYNAQIRSYAQTHGLPLIDFNAEILARRSGTSWNGTLLGLNDVHPSASGGGYDLSSDPYGAGGSAATHKTGAACDNVGYLLRAWLAVQKLKEVKYYVIDNGSPTPPADADGDGLPDAWEIAHFGNTTSQNGSGDPDGDGYTNAQEYAAGTDPMNAASPAPTPTPTPTPTPASSGGGGKKGGCMGSVAGEPSPLALLGVALTSLALVLASRKSGF